jgi:hypothetical protein
MWLLGPHRGRGQPLERGGGSPVGGALAPSRRGGVGPDFWSERPSRVKDTTTSGLLTSGLAAPGAGAGGRLERSLIRVSSAVGQCETVTAEVAPRPLGSEVRGGGEKEKVRVAFPLTSCQG